MRSDKSFFAFLKGGGARRLLPILVCGVLLLLMGSRALGDEDTRTVETVAPSAEEELAELCSAIDGVGKCRVMLTYGEDGEICAVAILCEGAGSVTVRERLVKLVTSLYGIRTNRISILELG